MTTKSDDNESKRGLSFTTKILVGLFGGALCGLFFGEFVDWLVIVGKVYVGLLQMIVLPYLTVALITNLGRLDFQESRRLLLRAAVVLLVLWALACVAVVLSPLAMPPWQQGSFFSTSAEASASHTDLLRLFVPYNPFESLSANLIPGVVVFFMFLGLALGGIKGKEKVIDLLDVLGAALLRVNGFVVKLMPYGTFAIAGGAAATMQVEEFERLQAYLLVNTVFVLILTFWVVPMLIAALTPFSYRQIMNVCKSSLVTAFATSKVIVVLPILIENTKHLFRQSEAASDDTDRVVEVIYPLAYPFPHIGKLMGLLFIPFAAWFVGSMLTFDEYPLLLGAGLLTYFGGPMLATPFLLDQLQIPADMFQLFLAGGVYTARLGDLLGVMHFVAMAILTTSSLTGMLRVRWRSVARLLIGAGALTLLALLGIRTVVKSTLEGQGRDDILASMLLMEEPVPAPLPKAAPNPVPVAAGQSVLDRVRSRGVIRVGFDPTRLPFCYRNANKDLVGFDVQLMQRLARDSGWRLEFVPYELARLKEHLAADHFDIAIGGITANITRIQELTLSDPYLDVHLALIVRDHDRHEFRTVEKIRAMDEVRIGLSDPTFRAPLQRAVPNATVVELPSKEAFFTEEGERVDALLGSAEAGSAWTLLYPQFTVTYPAGERFSLPLSFPIQRGDGSLRSFMDGWIALATRNGTVARAYDYWILGKDTERREPRWSIIRDVLGWVD